MEWPLEQDDQKNQDGQEVQLERTKKKEQE
jgi:hypothetical protein